MIMNQSLIMPVLFLYFFIMYGFISFMKICFPQSCGEQDMNQLLGVQCNEKKSKQKNVYYHSVWH